MSSVTNDDQPSWGAQTRLLDHHQPWPTWDSVPSSLARLASSWALLLGALWRARLALRRLFTCSGSLCYHQWTLRCLIWCPLLAMWWMSRCGLTSWRSLRRGWSFSCIVGTPCNTFTAARKLDGGPPPLRSKEAPEGLPGLRPSDEVLVFLGNLFLERSAEACFLVFCSWGRFSPLKIPLLSLIWDTAQMQQLLAGARAFALDFDQCAFGTPWLKPTDAAGQLHRSFGFSVRALLGRPCS